MRIGETENESTVEIYYFECCLAALLRGATPWLFQNLGFQFNVHSIHWLTFKPFKLQSFKLDQRCIDDSKFSFEKRHTGW